MQLHARVLHVANTVPTASAGLTGDDMKDVPAVSGGQANEQPGGGVNANPGTDRAPGRQCSRPSI